MSQAPIRLVDAGWGPELSAAIRADPGEVRIVCPFIKIGALDCLLSHRPDNVQVITRFNLADFAEGVSDTAALRLLLDAGASIRGIRSLHANWNENSQDVSHNRRTGTAWKPSPKPVQVSPS